MLCGQPPFYNKDKEKLFKNIKYSEPRLDFPFLSEDARDLCCKLLDKNPQTRLGSGATDLRRLWRIHGSHASIGIPSMTRLMLPHTFLSLIANPAPSTSLKTSYK
jgi:serine/threonine protein kinase